MHAKVRGFTLLELIIVIAIIATLSVIILVAVGSARERSQDTSIESNLINARSQAELYYHLNPTGYIGVCAATLLDDPKGIADFVVAADAENGAGSASCFDSATGWAFEAQHVEDDTLFYCVDDGVELGVYTGSTINGGDLVCGP